MPTEDKELILYEELADQVDKAIAEHKIELEKATEVMLIKLHPISRKCSISIIAACEEITLEMFEKYLNSAHYLAEKMVDKDSGLLKTFHEKAIN